MTTLVVVHRPISTLSDGHDLRVWHLCRALSAFETLVCFCIPLVAGDGLRAEPRTLPIHEIFADEVIPTTADLGHPSWRRHLRWSEVYLYRLGYPRYYRNVVRAMQETCIEHSVTRLVVFGSGLAEFVLPFRDKKILFDVCDSAVLTHERATRYQCKRWSIEFARKWLALLRWKQTEKCLPNWFSHVTTISDADRRAITNLAGQDKNVTTVPNGVALDRSAMVERAAPKRRGVAFWGNLGFAPNQEALRFFLDDIYRPYLGEYDIEVCVVGKDAGPWLTELAKANRRIRLMGYVEDLYSAIGEYPVMVNPMVIGSGMKNKVLEAFSMGMGVVSTSLGVEAIAGAAGGEHFLEANDPEAFALSVRQLLDNPEQTRRLGERGRRLVEQRYSWSAVSSKWVALFEELGE